jgi:F-type H+-transporting ATPase subunit epsilon
MTPEHALVEAPAERLILPAVDGELGILPGHAPMVVTIKEGIGRVTMRGATRRFAASAGFATIMPDAALVMLQTAEWEEDIDRKRAERDKRRAEEILHQKKSRHEYQMARATLARAMVRLRISDRSRN